MNERPEVDKVYKFRVYGHLVPCRVVRVHSFGTVDVVRLTDGEAFRLSGLGWL